MSSQNLHELPRLRDSLSYHYIESFPHARGGEPTE